MKHMDQVKFLAAPSHITPDLPTWPMNITYPSDRSDTHPSIIIIFRVKTY